jgi:hypothetical protein
MQKKYKYEKCKEFVQMQNKDSHLARFKFLEIPESSEEQSAEGIKEVMVEISNPLKDFWQRNNAKSDDDLIRVLAGIAKENGLKKEVKLIKVNGETYPEGIGKFEEYGMKEGFEFTIQSPDF